MPALAAVLRVALATFAAALLIDAISGGAHPPLLALFLVFFVAFEARRVL